MNCPHCGSERLRKTGKTKAGLQRYYCNDCSKYITERKEKVFESGDCPYCGGRTRKSGFTITGRQKYICTQCGRKNTENMILQLSNMEEGEMQCPYCGSYSTKRGGHLKSGSQRYKCRDCNKYFSENTVVKEPLNVTCPHCSSTHIAKSGHNPNGSQRYVCRGCGRKFSDEIPPRTATYYDKTCPSCGNNKAVKCGFDKYGNQYYRCTECNHKYLENGKFKRLTEEQIKQIREYHKDGMTRKEISVIFGVNEKTIFNATRGLKRGLTQQERIRNTIIKDVLSGCSVNSTARKYNYKPGSISNMMIPYYKTETITKKQMDTIIRYGIGCNVPIDWLARYIPCSQYMCNKVIKEYKKKVGI